tara:strand:+ start:469 stop:627 length:159 start_codon:yes stop_codon:yes gene_type:complete
MAYNRPIMAISRISMVMKNRFHQLLVNKYVKIMNLYFIFNLICRKFKPLEKD